MGISNDDEDGGGVDADGFGGNSPSWQGARTDISVPQNLYSMAAVLQKFSWMEASLFRVFASGQYIGGRVRSVDTQGAHTIGLRDQGWARAMAWCGHLPACLRLPFRLCLRVKKIGTLVFVSSNSENSSFSNNLK
jgi:hypothetical protein